MITKPIRNNHKHMTKIANNVMRGEKFVDLTLSVGFEV
jgi:hypothetical protein